MASCDIKILSSLHLFSLRSAKTEEFSTLFYTASSEIFELGYSGLEVVLREITIILLWQPLAKCCPMI